MKIVVTGHLGYIGAILVPLLTAGGHEILGIDSDLYRSALFGDPLVSVPALKKDIRDVEASDLQGYEAVIHLAGLSNDPLGDLDPALTLAINHRAAVRLAVKAKNAGVRFFLFASSCSIYGASDDAMLDENSPVYPLTPYAESKLLAENDLKQLADERFHPFFFVAPLLMDTP